MNILGFLISLLSIAFAVIGYFLKKTFDKIEELSKKFDDLWGDLHDMKPRVDVLWENRRR